MGCLHGSHNSGRDVQEVLEEVRPGAVVLELCESRHKALRQDLEKKAKVGVQRFGDAQQRETSRKEAGRQV